MILYSQPHLRSDSQVWNIWESLGYRRKSTEHLGNYIETMKQMYSGLSSNILQEKYLTVKESDKVI